jgi:hypothetical protein
VKQRKLHFEPICCCGDKPSCEQSQCILILVILAVALVDSLQMSPHEDFSEPQMQEAQ